MRYCPSRPTMFSDTPDVFGKDDDPLSWVFWTSGWWGGGGGKGVDRTGICPVENASEDGKGGPRLLGNMARKHQNWHQWESKFENWKNWHQWESKFENWKKTVSFWVETQKIAESRTKKGDQKHLYCNRGAGNFDLCLLCPSWTKTSALWLLRLMAALIGFYSVKSWLRHKTLEMHSKCIRLRRFILHSEYGKMPAHDFLIGRNQPTVRPSQVKHPGHTVG